MANDAGRNVYCPYCLWGSQCGSINGCAFFTPLDDELLMDMQYNADINSRGATYEKNCINYQEAKLKSNSCNVITY